MAYSLPTKCAEHMFNPSFAPNPEVPSVRLGHSSLLHQVDVQHVSQVDLLREISQAPHMKVCGRPESGGREKRDNRKFSE